jgi:thioredoxin reductase (NADPH)
VADEVVRWRRPNTTRLRFGGGWSECRQWVGRYDARVHEPVILVVDVDENALAEVDRELHDRYGRHYRIECVGTSRDARALLKDFAAAGVDVALVLASQRLDGVAGSELLADTRRLHPHALRALLIGWGDQDDPAIGGAIFEAIAQGRIDHYLIRPSSPPDEFFHNEVSGLLLEWADRQRLSPHTVFIVAESWSGRAYELRETLERCAMPHSFCLADSEQGQTLVAQAPEGSKLPLVVFPNGAYLTDPSNPELALASGGTVFPEQSDFDLVIVGAGPAGLSAAVYGASEGFSTLVVDEGGVGGQSTSSSLIRNFLGFPRGISGRRLAQNAYRQAWVFGAKFAFMQRVIGLQRDGGDLSVVLADLGPVKTRAVLLATGASYRRIGIPALEDLNGSGVFYGGEVSEAPGTAGRHVYIVGGANSAGQAALDLARYARLVTLVVRANTLDTDMSHYLVQQIGATPNIDVRLQSEVVGGDGDGRLERLVLLDRASGAEEVVAADALFVMIGAEPHTEWLPSEVRRDDHGYVLTGPDVRANWPRPREPFPLETSMPGVFAAGDVRHGSVKRVASAIGEGSAAIQVLHQFFAEELYPLGQPRDAAIAVATGMTGRRPGSRYGTTRHPAP